MMCRKWALWILLLCLMSLQVFRMAEGKAAANPAKDEDGDDDDEDSDDDGYEEDEDMIQLSHPFDRHTLCYPGLKEFKWRVAFNGTSDAGYWMYSDEYEGSTHCGTHMDAPCHFETGKWCIDDIPTTRLISPAVLIDIKDEANDGDNKPPELTPDDLEDFIKEHGEIPEGAVLLINSGNHNNWPNRAKYAGTDTSDMQKLKFPTISPSAARWIADKTKVVGVGIDSFSPDIAGRAQVHQILSKANIYILENVANLDKLEEEMEREGESEAKLFVMPMRIKHGSGAPCRILATFEEDGAATLAVSLASLLLTFLSVCRSLAY